MHERDNPDHVTIVKERGSSGGMMFFGLLAVIVLAVAIYFLTQGNRVSPSDVSVSNAAEKVGAAADKVGNAAEDAVKKTN